ncbi:2,4-dienoyl-CoA reductase [Streptomyces laurentii]|uniref:2,4-dienoyl-CoA reductase n=1 Tax=Streptomyces laurentii TaxID=39478 RepID=A0A160P4H0_STRLU|nr:2,4-dienoyl-CoA reductase [Streptomyces laurentii]
MALATPAAPTTGAAPAATRRAAWAIRRVRGRDMMLLRRSGYDAVTTGPGAGKVADAEGKDWVMRRIVGWGGKRTNALNVTTAAEPSLPLSRKGIEAVEGPPDGRSGGGGEAGRG